MSKIHPTAIISKKAVVGSGVEIGPYSIVHDNVHLSDRVKIGSYCELGIQTDLGDGSPLVISENSLIRSHSVFYESSFFGEKLVTGHRVTVRENTKVGKSFQIGTLSEIQGDCEIGDYVRFQSNVFVGKYTKIGNFVWILPYVVLTNDPTPPSDDLMGPSIEDFVTVCASALIMPGVNLGCNSVIASSACVTKDVPPYDLVAGIPAKKIKDVRDVLLKNGTSQRAYPWNRHFSRGYPKEVIDEWKENIDD